MPASTRRSADSAAVAPTGSAHRRGATRTPPDEQAAFRLDFAAWLASLGDRKRRVAEDLMVGERPMDVSNKHGLSQGRISQMRREMMESWTVFGGYLAGEPS